MLMRGAYCYVSSIRVGSWKGNNRLARKVATVICISFALPARDVRVHSACTLQYFNIQNVQVYRYI